MGRVTVCAGLLAYAVSLIIPSGGLYLSLASGVVVGWGITRLQGYRHRGSAVRLAPARLNTTDRALDEATKRVLSGAGKPWTVTAHSV
jgi:hypothetical protein